MPTVFDPVPEYTTPVPSIVLGGAEGFNHASLPDETTLTNESSYMHSTWDSTLEPFPMSYVTSSPVDIRLMSSIQQTDLSAD